MKIARQLAKEFWFPLLVAIAWAVANVVSPLEGRWPWTRFINIAAPTFFFVSWLTAQYFRVRKQAQVTASLVSIEKRVDTAIANLETQARNLDYISKSRIVQTFDECIDAIRDANEELADRSRDLKTSGRFDTSVFLLQRSNPFYPLNRSLHVLIGYAAHVIAVGQHGDLVERYTRTAHYVEELAGHSGTFIGRLNHLGIEWKTRRTKVLVNQICDQVERFRNELLKYSRYETGGYKGSQDLSSVLKSHIDNLRRFTE